jgi:hypothetical protein
MSSHTQQAQAQQTQAQAKPIQQQKQDDDLFVPGIGEPDDLLERIEPPLEAPIWPSLAVAMADLNAFTGPNGWALTSLRTIRRKMRLSGCFCTVTEVVHTDLVSMRISATVGLSVAKLDAHLTQSFATSLLLVVEAEYL